MSILNDGKPLTEVQLKALLTHRRAWLQEDAGRKFANVIVGTDLDFLIEILTQSSWKELSGFRSMGKKRLSWFMGYLLESELYFRPGFTAEQKGQLMEYFHNQRSSLSEELIRLGYSESGSVTKLLKLTKALQAIIT